MADGPYTLNDDGTAKDPVAFQKVRGATNFTTNLRYIIEHELAEDT